MAVTHRKACRTRKGGVNRKGCCVERRDDKKTSGLKALKRFGGTHLSAYLHVLTRGGQT